MIRHRRRGSAPLEVVMIFPTLVLLLAAILSVGAGGAARTAALSDARGEGWHRPVDPGDVLKLEHDPAATAVEHTERTPLALAAFGRRGQVATGTVVAQDRPWAHEDLPFPVLPADQGIAPHAALLDQLAAANGGPVADVSSVIGELNSARFLDPAVKPARPARPQPGQ
jgi:hypothetical protein